MPNCKACGNSFELSPKYFKPIKHAKSGFSSTCRKCENAIRLEREKEGGVYKIENTVTGKLYIGATSSLQRRFRDHRSELRGGRHFVEALQLDWNLYGELTFTFIVVERTEQFKERELYWIEALKPAYNQDFVQDGKVRHREETKQRIRQKNKGMPSWRKGRTYDDIYGDRADEMRKRTNENMAHDQAGANNGNAKLTEEQIASIQAEYGQQGKFGRKKGVCRAAILAEKYQVSEATISRYVSKAYRSK